MLNQALLVRAYRGERGPRTPVWLMRQAGRFLPEYRELRARYSLLEIIRTPRLASQVTLLPLERFDLDAGIIFSDILMPLTAMGIKLEFVTGRGPRIYNPVILPDDVSNLIVPDASESLSGTLEAIEVSAAKLKDRNLPLIGFCGGPFTLSYYLIQSSAGEGFHSLKRFLLHYPESWNDLQRKLVDYLADYLVLQAEAGASALQIVDSWIGILGPEEYRSFVKPYLEDLIGRIHERSKVPLVYYSTGSAGLLPYLAALSVNSLGIDWRISLSQANQILQGRFPLQGNLDPDVLAGPMDYLQRQIELILDQGSQLPAHIFNLGQGVLPETPVENVTKLISVVRGE